MYEDKKDDTSLKTKVSDEPFFRKDKDKTTNTIPNKKTKYNCCRYTFIANNKLIHDVPDFRDTEPQRERI